MHYLEERGMVRAPIKLDATPFLTRVPDVTLPPMHLDSTRDQPNSAALIQEDLGNVTPQPTVTPPMHQGSGSDQGFSPALARGGSGNMTLLPSAAPSELGAEALGMWDPIEHFLRDDVAESSFLAVLDPALTQ